MTIQANVPISYNGQYISVNTTSGNGSSGNPAHIGAHGLSILTSTTNGVVYTLANGDRKGQLKYLMFDTTASCAVITQFHSSSLSTGLITGPGVSGASITLCYSGTGWIVLARGASDTGGTVPAIG